MMPITVSRYARRRWNGMVQFRGSEIDATPDEPDDATFTAARAVGALRGDYLYREASEGADEIVELSHGHSWFDRDDPGGESGQHGIPF
jgi:hypothetical protein